MSLAVLLVTSQSPRVTYLTRDWVHELTIRVAEYLDEQSGGRVALEWRVFDWVTLPLTEDELYAAGWGLGDIAVPEVSKQLHVDLSSYSHYALVIDQQKTGKNGAWADDGRPFLHMAARDLTPALYAHELGHMYRARHADGKGPSGEQIEYGDGFCVMGGEGAKHSFVDAQHSFRDEFGQGLWRFCKLCLGIFFDGAPGRGHCPGAATPGTGHSPGVSDFVLPYYKPGSSPGQPDWRFCHKCYLLFYYGLPNKCPAGGEHVTDAAGGHNFAIPHDIPPGPGRAGWRRCRKCDAMFIDDSDDKGDCAAGDGHEADAASYNFVIPHDLRAHNAAGPGMVATTLSHCGWLDVGRNGLNVSGLATRPGEATVLLDRLKGAPPADSIRSAVAWADGLHDRRVLIEYRARDTRWDQGLPDALPGFSRWILIHLATVGGSNPVLVRAFPAELNGNAFIQEANLKITVTARDDHHDFITLRLNSLPPLGPEVQPNWGFCRFCSALFHDGFFAKGSCPGNRTGHAAWGSEYVLTQIDSAQADWRLCDNCRGLFFDSYDVKGACPAGGGHLASSSLGYVMPHDGGPGRQDKWRLCDKCFVLFYDGHEKKGLCPGSAAGHHAEGINFWLATL